MSEYDTILEKWDSDDDPTPEDLLKQWQDYFSDHINLDSSLDGNGVIRDWVETGFSPEEYQEWAGVGCFDAEKTRVLIAYGFLPEDVSELYDPGDGLNYGLSIGYAYCNSDLSITEVAELAQINL